MKKLVLVIISVFLLSVTAFAGNATFALSDAEGNKGDIVSLKLTLSCTEDANSFAVSGFTYDSSLLEFKGFTPDNKISDMCILPPTFDATKKVIIIGLKDPQKFDGELCTVEFEIIGSKSAVTKVTANTVAKNNSTVVPSQLTVATVTVNGGESKEDETPSIPSVPSKPSVPQDTEKVWKNPFADVKSSDWFYGAVQFTNEKGIINGVSANEFAPSSNVTRAMFVTLLYRLEGQPKTIQCTFADVKKGSWYENAVSWANEKGIVYGVSATEFAPDSNITREQMAAMLSRWAKYKGKDTSSAKALTYADKNDISEWATENVAWTTESGIMAGSGNKFLPKSFATRAEAATVIMRIAK